MTSVPATRPGPASDAPPPVLKLAQHLVSGPLRQVVEDLHPDLAGVCGYHFGWTGADGRPVDNGAGKLLRASLALLTAQATGSDPAVAVPGAVAVELVHNFSLLHDDIMDGDELRRGRPAAWVVFGPGLSILAGDALIAAALAVVARLPGSTGRVAGDLLTRALNRMIDGQAADLALERCPVSEVDVAHYLRACTKTTALLETATAIGAVLAGAADETVEALRQAGRNLGLSWQVANDVEDIWGDPAVTGKPPMSDLRRSKKTIPVILALRSGTDPGARLADQVATADRGEAALWGQADLIERAGGRVRAERLSRQYLDTAIGHLHAADLLPHLRDELAVLFGLVVTRDS